MFSLGSGRAGLEVRGDSNVDGKNERLRVFDWEHVHSKLHRVSVHGRLAVSNPSVDQFNRVWFSFLSASLVQPGTCTDTDTDNYLALVGSATLVPRSRH